MGNQTTKPEITVEYTRVNTEEPVHSNVNMQTIREPITEADILCFIDKYKSGTEKIPETYWKHAPMLYSKHKEVYLNLARQNMRLLEICPENQLTLDMCVDAIKVQPACLIHMRKNNMYSEVCLELLKQGVIRLDQVDIEFQTFDMYHEVIKKGGFEKIPKSVLTPDVAGAFELCLEAVKQNGMNLEHVPASLLDSKTVSGVGTLCLEAVKQTHTAFRFIPSGFWYHSYSDEGFEICKIKAVKEPQIAAEIVPNNKFKLSPEKNF